MKINSFVIYFFAACRLAEGLEAYIKGGSFVKYDEYPHSVFLIIQCKYSIACGGSILNQKIILTAAHCTEICDNKRTDQILAKYGHEDIKKMHTNLVKSYKSHNKYNEVTIVNDICLMLTMESINLNNFNKRVIVMENPPAVKIGYVAGWGLDEDGEIKGLLKHTMSKIHSPAICDEVFGKLAPEFFCAGPFTGLGAPLMGDSGSALVFDGYIQIGIVSHNIRGYSLIAYTNVSYYLKWITENSQILFCYD